jgi:hypothetical protein
MALAGGLWKMLASSSDVRMPPDRINFMGKTDRLLTEKDV